MRSACRLPVEHRGTEAPAPTVGPARAPGDAVANVLGVEVEEVESVGSRRVPSVLQSAQDNLLRCHMSLLTHCLNDGLDLCSKYQVTRLPQAVWSGVLSKDRVGVLRQLKNCWRELPARGWSGTLLIPNIPVGGGGRASFGAGRPFDPHRTLPETLLCDHSLNWCENLALIHHMTKLQQACDMKANVRFRDAPNTAAISAKKEWTRKTCKFRWHLQWLTEVRRRVTDTETDTTADMVLSQVQYDHKTHNYGRQYSSAIGVQRCSNLVRSKVLPAGTQDFDMMNAMTNLVLSYRRGGR